MLTLFAKLMYVFFYIGLFGFGGGYAMISLIQFEVVNNNGWMGTHEFANLLALSQMTPGPISINAATYVGFTVGQQSGYAYGIIGSLLSTFALILPSILMMWLVIKYLFKNEDNKYVKYVFSGLKPAVVGLIFSAGLMMMVNCDLIHQFVTGAKEALEIAWKTENFGTDTFGHVVSVLICAGTFVAVYFFKKNPIYLILISGVVGLVVY